MRDARSVDKLARDPRESFTLSSRRVSHNEFALTYGQFCSLIVDIFLLDFPTSQSIKELNTGKLMVLPCI